MTKKKQKQDKTIADMRAGLQARQNNNISLLSDAEVVRDYNARFGSDVEYIGMDALGKKVKPAPAVQICTNCEVNPAEYKLINGEEVTRHCTPCIQETLLDLVKTNYQVRIHNNGMGKDGLIELELL